MKKYIKGIITKVDKETGGFEVLASTSDVDRDGEIIDPKGWDIKNYLKNPIILWAHNYNELPIGVAEDVRIEDGALKIKGKFASEKANPKAQQVKKLIDEGIQKAVSVGFIPKERHEDNEKVITKAELLELSFVPVPANPSALALAVGKGFSMDLFDFGKKKKDKVAVSSHETEKADINVEWDGDKATVNFRKFAGGPEKEDVDFKKYRTGFTWFDSSEPKNFTSYKLPHHDIVDGSSFVVFRGVVTAMGALLGARGGVDIPEGDRRKVYNHLVAHYKQFDKEAPEFRNYNPEELKVLFGEGKDRHTHPECDPNSDKFDPKKCEEITMGKQARKIQTLILSKERFKTEDSAISWVKDHNFKMEKIDETENSFRFRQFDPGLCKDKTERTIDVTEGVVGVVCEKKKAKSIKKIDKKEYIIIELAESRESGEPKIGMRTQKREVSGQGRASTSNVVVDKEFVVELRNATLKAYRHNELVLSITKRILTKK